MRSSRRWTTFAPAAWPDAAGSTRPGPRVGPEHQFQAKVDALVLDHRQTLAQVQARVEPAAAPGSLRFDRQLVERAIPRRWNEAAAHRPSAPPRSGSKPMDHLGAPGPMTQCPGPDAHRATAGTPSPQCRLEGGPRSGIPPCIPRKRDAARATSLRPRAARCRRSWAWRPACRAVSSDWGRPCASRSAQSESPDSPAHNLPPRRPG